MTLGAIMIDVQGTTLTAAEASLLQAPAVGGIILFSRNYTDKSQLKKLVESLKQLDRKEPLLIAVDHEGGRVQRFREGFTKIMPMAQLGQLHQQDAPLACQLATDAGFILAIELLELGLDFSFAPVLDLAYGQSSVIGDRSFSDNPYTVIALASAFIQGMHTAGMISVGKHFPGHGFVAGDSHHELPVDNRELSLIETTCLQPFAQLIHDKLLDAIMPAHIIYPAVDSKPAGFSSIWLQTILRQQLGFDGVIFSDDLSMAGAEFAGSYVDRAHVALDAGCDMILVCNQPAAAKTVIDAFKHEPKALNKQRLSRLYGKINTHTERDLYQQRYVSACSAMG